MKRRDFFKATGVAVAALALRAVAQEGPIDAPGAVKVELYECGLESSGSRAGWLLLNTNNAGQLIVELHLEQGDPLTWFDVCVTVNNEMHAEDVGELVTNDQGKGNVHLALPIDEYPQDPYEPDILNIQVVLYWSVEE